MSYRFYPYQWAQKKRWPFLATIEDRDLLFGSFLRSGAARVRIPVTRGFEELFTHYLATGNVPEPGDVIQLVDDYWAALVQDVMDARGEDAVPGAGTIDVTAGSRMVTGHGTEFRADDEQRELIVGGKTYVIARVAGADQIELGVPYSDVTATARTYSIGVKLVGEPWQVRLPTSLVTLDPDAVALP